MRRALVHSPRFVLAAVLAAAAVGGCAAGAEGGAHPHDLDEVRSDTLYPAEDTSAVRIAALEDSVRRDSSNARAPIWLWDLGRLFRNTRAEFKSGRTDTIFVVRHRDQYWHDEPGAAYVYNGWHYRELARRFPDDTLADDAEYALTTLPMSGECEGVVACSLQAQVFELDNSVRQFPESPFARVAVHRMNDAFFETLHYSPKKGEMWQVDSADVRKVILHYDSTASALPPSLRAEAYEALAPIWDQWGNRARAREMRDWLRTQPKH